MKKIILSIFAICLFATSLSAVPARPGKLIVRQPDGSSIEIYKHGDEFGHWITDAQGRILAKDANGFYRVQQGVSAASIRKTAAANRAAKLKNHSGKPHGAKIATGTKHFLVILVQTSDTPFTTENPKEAFTNLLNQNGYAANGATGSAKDYYYDNSHGVFNPVFDVYGPVTLANPMKYYGENDAVGNDKHPEEAVVEGLNGIKDQVDFSQFDNDNDGFIDLVFMYYAGYGEADYGTEDTIWPHQYELSYAGLSFSANGVKAESYACTNELVRDENYATTLCGIGTACHEFAHAMGLPDFYDTDYETNDYAAGMYAFSTMDSGAYNNYGRTPPYFTIEERILLGWLEDSAIREFSQSGNITLPSVDENVAYKTPTDQDGEYFVYECRGSNGWDASLPTHGLIVTHVDKSSRMVSTQDYGKVSAYNLWNNWSAYNSVNENGKHPCCYVIPSSDQSNLLFGYIYYSTYQAYYMDDSNYPKIPFPGQNSITSYTPVSWNGVQSDISLSNIAYSANTVTFTVTVPSAEIDYHCIANPGQGKYSLGSSFALQLTEAATRPVQSVSWYYDGAMVSGTSVTLSTAGEHTIEAVAVLQDGKAQTITLEIQVQ